MRIHVLAARRVPDVPSPLLLDVADRLAARGHRVTSRIVEDHLVDVADLVGTGSQPAHDLYLLKSHTELALSLAGVLAARGARLLNPYDACVAAQDKLSANRLLRAAGVPVPRTLVTGSWRRVAEAARCRDVVVKPLRGHRGRGVEVVPAGPDVGDRPEPGEPLVVQDHVPGPGEDLKVYVVGDRVWAVRKPFSPSSFSVAGRPVAVTEEVRALALRTGAATGLELFGVDVIEGPEGPVVVDLNYFPGYKGCEGVAGPLADLVHARAVGCAVPRVPVTGGARP